MKYVLVDKGDNIVSTVDLQWDVGLSGARTYFLGVKKLKEKDFDEMWKVMTEDEYRVRQSKKPIEWWIEEKEITDEELKI